jgi:hypothetical protein
MRSRILLCILLLCIVALTHANRASRSRASVEVDDDDVPAAPRTPAPVTLAPVSAEVLLDRQKKQALMQQQRSSSRLTALREREASLLDEIIRENQANIQRDGNPNSADSSSDISRSRTRGTGESKQICALMECSSHLPSTFTRPIHPVCQPS